MRVQFVFRDNGPERLVCEAEIVFDDPGPLWNTKLLGFSIWQGSDGEMYVTLPSRAFGAGPERKYFDYLRAANEDASAVKAVKAWILAEYRRHGASSSVPGHVVGPASPSSSSRRREHRS